MFWVDNSLSGHADDKKEHTIISGKCPSDGLDDSTITAEKEYSVNITELEKKYMLELVS